MREVVRFLLIATLFGLLNLPMRSASAQSNPFNSSQITPLNIDSPTDSDMPGDEFWTDLGGVSGPVYSIVPFTNGTLSAICIGGDFGQVGSIGAENVACWNRATKTWFSLGSVGGPVHALVCVQGYLYAGGIFGHAGSTGAHNIARYNFILNAWEDIGGVGGIGGLGTGSVLTLESDRPDTGCGGQYVYVGGEFGQAGNVSAFNVARYDSSNRVWQALAPGYSNGGAGGPVYALAVNPSILGSHDVYVGGMFAGVTGTIGVNAYNLARWNSGTRNWSEVRGSVDGPVHSLALCSSKLYVGGLFGSVGAGISAHNLAVWDLVGGTWSELGGGASNIVEAIACFQNRVYVGGEFGGVGSIGANHVARWNTTTQQWFGLGSGTSGPVYSFYTSFAETLHGTWSVYVGGHFYGAGKTGAQNLALYTGDYDQTDPEDANWNMDFCAAEAPNAPVHAIASSGGLLYYGGEFTTIGSLETNHLAIYNPQADTWSAAGEGVNGDINAIVVDGDHVYLGGAFKTAGGKPIAYLARWNQANGSWEDLGGGPSGIVNAIAISNGSVYVGGSFATAGGKTVNNVARWDLASQSWYALGEGSPGVDSVVNALAASGADLYVGGQFTHAQALSTPHVAHWNGSAWSGLSSGINGEVFAVAVHNGSVYVTGLFTQAGEIAASSVAYWDGSAWQAMPGMHGTVRAIAFNLGDIYVAGSFIGASGATGVAHWNGTTWNRLGQGIDVLNTDHFARSLKFGTRGLYIGGNFLRLMNDLRCSYKALWMTNTTPPGSGSISGQVHNPGSAVVPGVRVQACLRDGSACPWTGTTNADGAFAASALPDGEYILKAYPPLGSANLPATSGSLLINGGGALQQDLTMSAVSPLPSGISLTPSRITSIGVARVNWRQALHLSASGCVGGSATYQVRQAGVTLASGVLSEQPAGQYRAELEPLYPAFGYVQISLVIACPGLSSQVMQTFDIYIDPTGTLRMLSGAPIEGATMTLFSYDPQTLSLSPVPADSSLLSPINRVNPELSDAAGHFGWDMVAGSYVIRAEKQGCTSASAPYWGFAQTGLLESPAELVDLDLQMNCTNGTIRLFMPIISR